MEILTSFPTLKSLQTSQPELRALLFDMDGTLFQTEEIHGEALRQMARDWDLRPPFPAEEVELRLKGMSDRQVLELAQAWPGFPPGLTGDEFVATKNAHLLKLIPTFPQETWVSAELVSLLRCARDEGLLTAVVTSSERVITDLLLRLGGVEDLLNLVITLQDVRFPKPHPAPYLQAMVQLAVGPREVVIFEDSAPGLAAARASGARVIQVDWWRSLPS